MKKLPKSIFTFCFVLLLGVSLSSQTVLSLESAIVMGLENSMQIKIDEANIQIADNNNTWAVAGRTPTIDIVGTMNPTLINDNNPASFLNGTFALGGIGVATNVNWTVFAGGRIKIAKEELELLGDQQRLLRDVSVNTLVRDIIQAYQDVLFQEERLALLKESLELSQVRLTYEETRKQFGSSSSFNILQFEEALLTDSINILSQEDIIQTSKNNLKSIMQVPSDMSIILDDRLEVVMEDLDELKLRSQLEEKNYTLRTLRMVEDLNAINTRIAETATKPTVNLTASTGFTRNYFKFFMDDPNTGEQFPGVWSNRINLNLGADVSWNFYDGGLRKNDIQNAKIQEDIAQYDVIRTTVELDNQIDRLVESYNNQKSILTLNDKQLDVVRRNLVIAEEQYKAGRISSIDYRSIQNQFLNASFTKTTSIYNLLITKSEIDWLIGSYSPN